VGVLASWILDMNERADDLEGQLAAIMRDGLPVNEG